MGDGGWGGKESGRRGVRVEDGGIRLGRENRGWDFECKNGEERLEK